MSKKLISLLLTLCLVVGLLPAAVFTAFAAGEALSVPYILGFDSVSYELTRYDAPIYFKNKEVITLDTERNTFTYYVPTTSGASENSWNAKLVWKTGDVGPTLYLDGFRYDEYNDETGFWKYRGEGYPVSEAAETTAITVPATAPLTIVVTGQDSLIETKYGIPFSSNLTIKSEGDAKLAMHNMSSGINGASGCSLTLNANLDVAVATYCNDEMMVVSATNADITVEGGNMNLTGTTKVVALKTFESGNVTVNGGNVYAKGGYRGIVVPSADYMINVNGGSLTVAGSYSAVYKGTTKGTPTVAADYCAKIMTGTKTNGSNATVKETVASACYIKIANHDLTETPANPANDTAPGNTAYWTCGICGKYYSDAEGKTEILENSWVIPTLPPTEAPTQAPTTVPTTAPTEAPTTAPTEAPTTMPTVPTGGYDEADVEAYNRSATVIKTSGANIWSKPYTSGVSKLVRTEKYEAKVNVVGKVVNFAGGLWYKLSDGNWVYSTNVRITDYNPADVQPCNKIFVVTSWGANIWSKPYSSGDSKVIKSVEKTAALSIVAQVRNSTYGLWYQLADGGWVYSHNVTERLYDPAKVIAFNRSATVIVTGGANVWGQPSTSSPSKVARVAKYDTKLTVVAKYTTPAGGLWYQLTDGNWVYGNNIRITDYNPADVETYNKTFVVTSWGANIWSKPYSSGDSRVVKTVPKDAKLSVVAKVRNSTYGLWYQLSDGGWVYSHNVAIK